NPHAKWLSDPGFSAALLAFPALTSISECKLIRCEPSREMGCLTPVFQQPASPSGADGRVGAARYRARNRAGRSRFWKVRSIVSIPDSPAIFGSGLAGLRQVNLGCDITLRPSTGAHSQ